MNASSRAAERPRGELVVLGVGPHGLGQLTLDALEALKGARLVLAAARGAQMRALCEGLGVRCEALSWRGSAAAGPGVGTPGLVRRLARELARRGRVCVVVDGSPALFSVADALRGAFPAARVLPGVGSLDAMLVALRAAAGDLAAVGVRALNLEGLPARAPLADPHALTFLYNAGGLARRAPRAFAALARRLAAAGVRRVWLIELADGGDAVVETTPAGLPEAARRVGVNATVAVGPL